MSFQSPDAYLPKDLLDSDDDIAQEKTYIINNILDDDDMKTADNSSNSGNSSSPNTSSIFSVQPFAQTIQQEEVIDPVVGWKCCTC